MSTLGGLARVLEGVAAHVVEGDVLHEAGRDDAVGIDVVAAKHAAATAHGLDSHQAIPILILIRLGHR